MTEKQRILIVDDEAYVCDIIARWLDAAGYLCETALNGESAVEMLEKEEFDLVIADIMMPGMSGVDLLTFVKSRHASIAVVMITAVDDSQTTSITLDLGAYGYIFKPFEERDVLLNVTSALERRRLELVNAEYRQRLEKQLQEQTLGIAEREEEMVSLLLSILSLKSEETMAHCVRVGNCSALLARYLRWDTQKVDMIKTAARLHDIGKVGIPDEIIYKPTELTRAEYEIVKRHARIGANILNNSNLPLMRMASEIALSHHERWDGTGYPMGFARETIPHTARIVSIVDTFDTLIHHKRFRPAFTEDKAMEIMNAYREKLFDPRIFDYFVTLLPAIRRIQSENPDPIDHVTIKSEGLES